MAQTRPWNVKKANADTERLQLNVILGEIDAGMALALDPTLLALGATAWQANAMAIGTGVDTVAQVGFSTNTFPARASTGNLVAKTITDWALNFVQSNNSPQALTTLGAADDTLVVHKAGTETITGAKTFSADVNLSYAAPILNLNKASGVSGSNAYIAGQTAGLNRWVEVLGSGGTESGSNVGSDYFLARYTDAGGLIDVVLSITRSTGSAVFSQELTFQGTQLVGYRGIPQNSQSGNYTCVLADSGKEIYHPSGAGAGDTFTIPANGSVAYPIGTVLGFCNMDSNSLSIAITTDTMYLGGVGTTGTRTLAQYGFATAQKLTSTTWLITGTGLT